MYTEQPGTDNILPHRTTGMSPYSIPNINGGKREKAEKGLTTTGKWNNNCYVNALTVF
jgi:hypothetical protein